MWWEQNPSLGLLLGSVLAHAAPFQKKIAVFLILLTNRQKTNKPTIQTKNIISYGYHKDEAKG